MTSQMLLESAATFGDEVANYRSELLVHCYRMLGTLDEAEDALQEALTRAWQRRQTFRRSISFRAWLYRIATNVCLNAIEARKRGRVRAEVSIDPFPDDLLTGVESPETGPEARYDAHESISLAFLTVLQVLPPRQRAVLLLRDVLVFHATEVARLLEMSVPAVNSALQRARATLHGNYRPIAPADLHPGILLERYVRAWESADVAGLVALLREDAVLAMPPMPTVSGARQIGQFLAESIFARGPTRLLAAHANRAPAFAAYVQEPGGGRYVLFALLVIAAAGHEITHIDAFADPRVLARFDFAKELAG
ncbi:MAG TPA: RNA polymerase subunit sigma-70 [Candidatus Dormibacteraeota bacterium]